MKVFAIASVALLIATCALAAPSLQDNRVESENGNTFARAARYLGTCLDSEDMTTCLAVKGITALNRAARSNNIDIVSGVSFKRDPSNPISRTGKALSENDVYAELPTAAEERTGRLVDMAMKSAADFLSSHNLEVKIPTAATQEVARALEEGRGKMKKLMGPLALILAGKVALLPLIIGGLALLVFKAVFVAKIALILALIVGGSRLFSGFGNKFGNALGGYGSNAGWNTVGTGGWSSGASSAYPYARSLNSNDEAQQLAYAQQVPTQ